MGRRYLIILLTLSLFTASTMVILHAESMESVIVRGKVIDKSDGMPLYNANVQLWDISQAQQTRWRLVASTNSDREGFFQAEIRITSNIRVFAYFDLPETSGIDYVPAYKDIVLPHLGIVTLELSPGGTVHIQGELRFVESSTNPYSSVFTALCSSKDDCPIIYDSCSTSSPSHTMLGLDERTLVVPANIPIHIMVNSSMLIGTKTVSRSINLEELRVYRGDLVRLQIDLPVYRFNLATVENLSRHVEQRLDEVERQGFYISLERQEYAKFKDLLGSADEEIARASYDSAYADLREAYVGLASIYQRINTMYSEAASSVSILALFLNLTAVVIASFMVDRWPLKLLLTFALSVCFFTALFFVYPGSRLVEPTSFYQNVIATFCFAFISLIATSYFSNPKIVQIFSIAKKNLRRRTTRFLLALISVTLLAMSFVTLTSFSTGYGLEISSSNASGTASGLLVRRPLSKGLPYTTTFLPLDVSTLNWLRSKQEIVSVAPKYENAPLIGNIGLLAKLNEPTSALPVYGILGIQPTEEAEIPDLSRIAMEGNLLKEEGRPVLISRKAADAAGIDVGEQLSWSSVSSKFLVTIVGLFDDNALRRIVDFDSASVVPKKTVIIPADPPIITVESCDPSEVIITTADIAKEMSIAVGLSRIRVLLRDSSLAFSMGRRIALERDLAVWSLDGNKVYHMVVGEYTEAKGFSIMIPWAIVMLNVVVTMWNAVFERRKEVAILSSVGLNPTHIGGLFMAEAAVIGFTGGGIGYLFGLVCYRLLSILNILVEVRQKVSALWSVASVGISLAAVLVGTGFAIRYSTGLTPSLIRRWSMGQKYRESSGPVEFPLPFRVNDVDALFEYVKGRVHSQVLSSHASLDPLLVQKMTKLEESSNADRHVKAIFFNFAFGQHEAVGAFPFGLIAERKLDDANYLLKMVCRGGNASMMNECVSYVRMLIVDWSARRGK